MQKQNEFFGKDFKTKVLLQMITSNSQNDGLTLAALEDFLLCCQAAMKHTHSSFPNEPWEQKKLLSKLTGSVVHDWGKRATNYLPK